MSSNMFTSMLSGMNSYSRVRMNGLASGMDTQGTIDAMSMASKNRVVKQWQQIESLTWKQSAYRTHIDTAKKFQNTYFNRLNPSTYMGSDEMFRSFKAESVRGVKVDPTSSTSISRVDITEILSKASAAELKSNANFTASSDIKLDIDLAALQAEMANGGDKLQINMDGLVKTIKLQGTTETDIKNSLVNGINTAYGSNKVSLDANGVLSVSGKSQINIFGAEYTLPSGVTNYGDEIMKSLGLKDGVSNRISRYSTLADTDFANKLQGSVFEFSINDVDFKFSSGDTISNIMSTINNSTAGAKIVYSSVDDKFTLTATQTGAGNTLDIKQKSGNLLDSLMGYKEPSSTTITSNGLNSGTILGANHSTNPRPAISEILEKGISLTIDGVTKNIFLPTYSDSGTLLKYETFDEVASNLNAQIKKEFGGASDVYFSNTGATSMELKSKNNRPVSIGAIKTGANADGTPIYDDKLLNALGFKQDGTTIAKTTTTLKDALGITGSFTFNNGTGNITLSDTDTVADLIAGLEGSGNGVTFDATTGYLSIKIPAGSSITTTDPDGSDVLKQLFGTDVIEQPNTAGSPTVTVGTNAKLTVNGSEIERTSNTFTVDGVNINIEDAAVFTSTGTAGVPAGDKITTDITRNTDATFDNIVKFVDEYNKMVAAINKDVTKRPTRGYDPLTDEQKQAMSDSEVEKWEEKAKEGLLHGDKDLISFASQLRSSMYAKPSNSPFALYDIGISTGEYSKGGSGQLIIDESKLKKALGENPDGVAALFTDKEDGVATRVTKILDNYVKDLGVDKGILVSKAGMKNSPSENSNSISDQLEKYKSNLKTLQLRYKNEQDRLWNTFTAMEKAIASMNSQSSSISQMFGGGQ